MKLDSVRTKSQLSEAPHGELETAIVKLLIDVGFQHKRVAALFDCNQGRIAEIATGKKGAGIQYTFAPVAAPEWPLDAPQVNALPSSPVSDLVEKIMAHIEDIMVEAEVDYPAGYDAGARVSYDSDAIQEFITTAISTSPQGGEHG